MRDLSIRAKRVYLSEDLRPLSKTLFVSLPATSNTWSAPSGYTEATATKDTFLLKFSFLLRRRRPLQNRPH